MTPPPQLSGPPGLPGLLELLASEGVLSRLDYEFARTLATFEGANEDTLLCAAMASRAVQLGHVCVDLHHFTDTLLFERKAGALATVQWPAAERLMAALRASPLCGDGSKSTPLVLDAAGRLYLHRYFRYEKLLAEQLTRRAQPMGDVDLAVLGRGIRQLFVEPSPEPKSKGVGAAPSTPRGVDAHRVVACVAVLHSLTVICGGPGTGKTTTVVKILALLQEQALASSAPPLRMLLLAPTGKAARRLASAVQNGLEALALPEAVKAGIPVEASTIHRALGGAVSGRFRHDAKNPLPADVVLVDEVSMVDLALLYRLMNAIRPHSRVILQGDKDQLASIEAGAILGDIYDARAQGEWSAPFAAQVEQAIGLALPAQRSEPGLWDCLVSLDESYRYRENSHIGRLARAINRGDAGATLRTLLDEDAQERDCQLFQESLEHTDTARTQPLEAQVVEGYAPFIRSVDPREKLARLGDYRILCAHRQGPEGALRLNQGAEHWLERAGLLTLGPSFYENRPIIITENDYALGLFNGDVGVVVRDGDRLRVCFESSEGLRFLAPGRLPPHETVFAMTIHKSQGSEFDAVSIVLPEVGSALVSRELLYTAVTRARQRVYLFGKSEVVRSAVQRSVQRASGLRDALWGRSSGARVDPSSSS